jgi:hypothetical protein
MSKTDLDDRQRELLALSTINLQTIVLNAIAAQFPIAALPTLSLIDPVAPTGAPVGGRRELQRPSPSPAFPNGAIPGSSPY